MNKIFECRKDFFKNNILWITIADSLIDNLMINSNKGDSVKWAW